MERRKKEMKKVSKKRKGYYRFLVFPWPAMTSSFIGN
jgi:hypothetical protein